jgi:hypothetical protein
VHEKRLPDLRLLAGWDAFMQRKVAKDGRVNALLADGGNNR